MTNKITSIKWQREANENRISEKYTFNRLIGTINDKHPKLCAETGGKYTVEQIGENEAVLACMHVVLKGANITKITFQRPSENYVCSFLVNSLTYLFGTCRSFRAGIIQNVCRCSIYD